MYYLSSIEKEELYFGVFFCWIEVNGADVVQKNFLSDLIAISTFFLG